MSRKTQEWRRGEPATKRLLAKLDVLALSAALSTHFAPPAVSLPVAAGSQG
jgi:hypothetical protein